MTPELARAPRLRRVSAAPAVLLALGVILAACGGSTDASDGADEVASLEEAGPDTSVPEVQDGTLAADEAALAFSQCLRGQGLDVPDIGVDAAGNVDLRSAFEDIDRSGASFRDAVDACSDLLGATQFGGGRGALADSTEFQDALLVFSDCIREQGFEDVGDLTLGQPGADGGPPNGGEGDGGGPGAGDREGGFGDRSAGLARRLGLDPEVPAVIDALETCQSILDTALADAGLGQPGGGN